MGWPPSNDWRPETHLWWHLAQWCEPNCLVFRPSTGIKFRTLHVLHCFWTISLALESSFWWVFKNQMTFQRNTSLLPSLKVLLVSLTCHRKLQIHIKRMKYPTIQLHIYQLMVLLHFVPLTHSVCIILKQL